MKTHRKPLVIAVATALGTLGTLPVQALQITTSPVSFSNSASVTDNEGGSSTSNNNASLGSSSLNQFDSTSGVLTGTTLSLTSTRTTTVTALGSGTSSSKPISKGTGSSAISITGAPGVTYTPTSATVNSQCTGTKAAGCSVPSTSTQVANLAVDANDLNSYVGTSTLSITGTATTLTAEQTASVFPGAESTTHSISAKLSATYTYLLHAAPSFNDLSSMLTLDLDFGTVFLGDVADMDFSIYNLAPVTGSPIDRVGLDLDTFDPFPVPFSFNLSTFYGLASGSNNIYTASMNTSTLGEFKATYHLYFSDEDVGASSSRFSYQDHPLMFQLTLNLSGRVEPIPVPEPGALSLLGVGLLGLPFARRRRS